MSSPITNAQAKSVASVNTDWINIKKIIIKQYNIPLKINFKKEKNKIVIV